MSKLLSSDCFDSFLLEEADIRMAAAFSIDGHLNRDFYDTDVWEDRSLRPYDFMPWHDIREYCRSIIKGNAAPSYFRFTLRLKPEYLDATLRRGGAGAELISNIGALLLNIRLERGKLMVLTGIFFTGFTTDKSADGIWDGTVKRFLHARGIEFE